MKGILEVTWNQSLKQHKISGLVHRLLTDPYTVKPRRPRGNNDILR